MPRTQLTAPPSGRPPVPPLPIVPAAPVVPPTPVPAAPVVPPPLVPAAPVAPPSGEGLTLPQDENAAAPSATMETSRIFEARLETISSWYAPSSALTVFGR